MSVYTIIEEDELKSFLSNYDVGELVDYQGISDGIENTNYFVNTSSGRFVLTIFEQHDFKEMQYYLNLMHHLADHKVPSANPVADKQGNYLSHFKNKPNPGYRVLISAGIHGNEPAGVEYQDASPPADRSLKRLVRHAYPYRRWRYRH